MSRLLRSHVIRSLRRAAKPKPLASYSTFPPTSASVSDPYRASMKWSLLKIGAFSAVGGTIGAISYISYAFTLEEVDKKRDALWFISDYSVEGSASGFEKLKALVYSSAIEILVKIAGLYIGIRTLIENQLQVYDTSSSEKLLAELSEEHKYMYTLVLDLEETLVKSDWKHENICVRPGVDDFLEHLGMYYEIIVYSDQPEWYVKHVIKRLDLKGKVRYALGRKATRYVNGKYSRDLSKLNRNPSAILYVSGHALESTLQPENSVPIKPWKSEDGDLGIVDLIPFLHYIAVHKPDVRDVLATYKGHDIAREFEKRSKEHERSIKARKRGFLKKLILGVALFINSIRIMHY